MGKGGGCVPSKKKRPPATADNALTRAPLVIENKVEDDAALQSTQPTEAAANLKIFIVFYSMYGHVEGLARRMKRGVDGVDGVEAVLYRVPETLPPEVLEQMRVPPKDDEIPEIPSAMELAKADGFLFGFPTRYGCMAAQMKAFFDSTGQLWQEQRLAGKPAGFFVSTGTQGGGQETTAVVLKAWLKDTRNEDSCEMENVYEMLHTLASLPVHISSLPFPRISQGSPLKVP